MKQKLDDLCSLLAVQLVCFLAIIINCKFVSNMRPFNSFPEVFLLSWPGLSQSSSPQTSPGKYYSG